MLTLAIASFFFFNDTATTEIYTLSLHDALPICRRFRAAAPCAGAKCQGPRVWRIEKITMPGTTAVPDIELVVEDIGGGGGGPTAPSGGSGDGDDGNKRRRPGGPPSPNRYYTGIALGIRSILMFFMALASAFLVRRGTSGDWIPVHLPAEIGRASCRERV